MNKAVLLFLIAFLISCEKKSTINIITKNAFRVKVGTPILFKGIQIGEVESYSFYKNNVALKLNIENSFIPLNQHYQFNLRNINLFDVGIVLSIEDSINNKVEIENSTLYCDLIYPIIDRKIQDCIEIEGNIRLIEFFEKKFDSLIRKHKS